MASRRTNNLLQAGSRAPDFRLPRLDGGESSLRDLLSGGEALLAFFKVTCPVCQMTFPFLERLHRAGAIRICGISQNDPEDTRDFNREFGVTFPCLLDPEDDFPASNAFGISSVPTMFLVQPDTTIARVTEGWSRRDIEWLGEKSGATVLRPGDRVPEMKPG
jgi:peroxiredoxin